MKKVAKKTSTKKAAPKRNPFAVRAKATFGGGGGTPKAPRV